MDARFYGQIAYHKGLALQQTALDLVKQGSHLQYLIGCEHEPVLTRGRRLHGSSVATPGLPKDFSVVDVDRGGELALHTPGQLVIYPVLNLKTYKLSVRDYICRLHTVTKHWLKSYGVIAVEGDQSGLWTTKGKIAFIGIRVQQGIVSHGIAINIRNDLSYYQGFTACGVINSPVDRLVSDESMASLFFKWCQTFRESHESTLCSTAVKAPSEIR